MSQPFLSIHDLIPSSQPASNLRKYHLAPPHLAVTSVQPYQRQRLMRGILASSSQLQGLCDIHLYSFAAKNSSATSALLCIGCTCLATSPSAIQKTLKLSAASSLLQQGSHAEIAACFSWRRHFTYTSTRAGSLKSA